MFYFEKKTKLVGKKTKTIIAVYLMRLWCQNKESIFDVWLHTNLYVTVR